MSKTTDRAKALGIGIAALAAVSVVASRAIDAYQERKYAEADARPCNPTNPEPGQRPYPQDLPGHEEGIYERYVKRPQDFACALVALVCLSPVMGATALLVRTKLGSPVIFKQKRPGKDGCIFELYKFRSMTDERDAGGNLLPDEARLTSFGKLLRSTSLDELPELVNILKGDMSVVGPRPQLVRDIVFMTDNQLLRQTIRPGLTGLAQIHGRNSISWNEKLKWDVAYLNRIGFVEDWHIILETLQTAVIGREGITDGEHATSLDYGDYLLEQGLVSQEEYDCKQILAEEVLSNARQ